MRKHRPFFFARIVWPFFFAARFIGQRRRVRLHRPPACTAFIFVRHVAYQPGSHFIQCFCGFLARPFMKSGSICRPHSAKDSLWRQYLPTGSSARKFPPGPIFRPRAKSMF